MPNPIIHSLPFQEQFLKELQRVLDKGKVYLDIQRQDLFTIIGHVHLALRHPGNRGPSAQHAHQIVKRFIDILAETDLLRTGLEAGADERYDQPPVEEQPVKRIVVCLCGSTRFKQAYIDANFRETMCGRVVLSVGMYSQAGGAVYTPSDEEKTALDLLHKDKILMANESLFLNEEDYLGESSLSELEFARKHKKRVRWWRLPSRHALDYEGD